MRAVILFTLLLATTGCAHDRMHDYPQLAPGTRVEDVTFYSAALARTKTYRIILPASLAPDAKLPVMLLLHGAGDDFRSWSNKSQIAAVAARGVILVMPDAGNSFYIDSAHDVHAQYETYIAIDLLQSVYAHVPQAARDRASTGVIGISRGGFGAFLLALKHPQQFSFVGGLSSAFDLPERLFRLRELANSAAIRRAFGPRANRAHNDPFALLAATSRQTLPTTIVLTCGDRDTLLATNRRMDAALTARHIPHSFAVAPGDHDWSLWNAQLPSFEAAVLQHFHIAPEPGP